MLYDVFFLSYAEVNMITTLAISTAGDIALTVFLLIIGLVLIIKGGDWFVDSASKIAELSGVPQFIIGATIVSIGTTLPELITSAIAASQGQADMALGNAVGSVNANIGLIMALSLLCMPHAFDKKAYLFKGITMITSIVVLTLLCIKLSLNAYLSIILLLIFVAFMTENIIVGKKEATHIKVDDNGVLPENTPEVANAEKAEEKFDKTAPTTTDAKKEKTKVIVKSILFFVIGAACIVGGAKLLVTYGTKLATYMHIPERIIAVTIVAIGTSLPELVTTITSIVKKKHDLSVGNIIGANVIDLCLILPVCAMISGGNLPIAKMSLFIDMPFCIAFTVLAIIPALITKKFTKAQGAAILCTYIAYLVVSIVPLGI